MRSDMNEDTPKIGWKTSEFWLALLGPIVATLLASNLAPEGSAVFQVLTFLSAVLTSIGYSHSRMRVKVEAYKTKQVAMQQPRQ